MNRLLVFFLLWPSLGIAADLPARPLFAPAEHAVTSGHGSVPSTSKTISNFMYLNENQWAFDWRGQRVTADKIPATFNDVIVSPDYVGFSYDGQSYSFDPTLTP